MNPGGSVKDRAALGILNDAIKNKKLKKNGIIVEGTAGNTGISLTQLGNSIGCKTIIVMPETQSNEKKQLLKIRTQGYSLNHGEAYENTYGIGVAILDKDKRSFAGISLSGSRNIMNPKNTIDYVKLLQSASIKISKLIVDN